jgi:hypothetical protein
MDKQFCAGYDVDVSCTERPEGPCCRVLGQCEQSIPDLGTALLGGGCVQPYLALITRPQACQPRFALLRKLHAPRHMHSTIHHDGCSCHVCCTVPEEETHDAGDLFWRA